MCRSLAPLSPQNRAEPSTPSPSSSDVVKIGVAYGTEKRNWFEWAVKEFASSEDGRKIRVKLIPTGSMEAAHRILSGDKEIHVWSPASGLYRETLLRDWEARNKGKPSPIAKEECLALTPMVFVMYKSRFDAFTIKCPELSFRTIGFALKARAGWGSIAERPEWGRFKFSHTHPNQSNSGLMTLLLLAYEFHNKTGGLTVADVMNPEFQEYLARLEHGVTGLSNSTGNLMREMVLRGPSTYDVLMVYEAVVIDSFESPEGRWGPLFAVYPKYNLWSDNPYYVLNTPWTTPVTQKAAETFLRFLMSVPAQTKAMTHGFRPGNPSVPMNGKDSPFVRYQKYGLKINIPSVCEAPSVEVIENLQQSWIRHGVLQSEGGQ